MGSNDRFEGSFDQKERVKVAQVDKEMRQASELHNTALMVGSKGLFGRKRELEILNNCFENCQQRKQLILIEGPSGVGKTALALHLKRKVGHVFAHGKYNINQSNEPFGALAQACRSICEQLPRVCSFHNCVEELRTHLGMGDTEVLFRFLPSIAKLVGAASENSSKKVATDTQSNAEDQTKLHLALRRFLRVVGEHVPLILMIDDAQWADQDSIDLLEFLLKDREGAFMVVCCYRDEEVHQNHRLLGMTAALESDNQASCLAVRRIELEPLDRNAVLALFCAFLHAEPNAQTEKLVDLVCKVTNGNPFFVNHFLSWLLEENVLERTSLSTCRWDFDQVQLAIASDSCDIASVIKLRLEKFPLHAQNLFKLASLLGTEIHQEVFGLVVSDYFLGGRSGRTYLGARMSPASKSIPVGDVIEMGVNADLFWHSPSGVNGIGLCVWQNEKVQEAVQQLMSTTVREQTSLKIGKLLLQKLSKNGLNGNIYLVAGLLNTGVRWIPTTNSADRVALAELNLAAGKKSINSSAFGQAAHYFRRGIYVLPRNGWRVYNELALDLYSYAGESTCCIGQLSESEKLCKAVISKAGIQLIAKQRAYSTLIKCLQAHGRAEEVIKTCVDVLALLDHNVGKRFLVIRAIPVLLRAKANVDQFTSNSTKETQIQVVEKLWIMNLLGDMFLGAYFADRDNFLVTSVVHSFQFSERHGICKESPLVAARMGLILATSLGAYEAAVQYGEYALSLLSVLDDKALIAMTYLIVFGAIFHWQRDLEAKPMRAGYLAGIAVGNTEAACYDAIFDVLFRFFTGNNLSEIAKELACYVPQYIEYDQPVRAYGIMQQQMVANLIGESSNTVVLSGSYMDLEVVESDIQNGVYGKSLVFEAALRGYEMILCFFFDDFESFFKIRRMMNEKTIEQVSTGQFFPVYLKYMVAMSAIALFRKRRKRKYKRIARRSLKQLKILDNAGVSCFLDLDLSVSVLHF